MNPLQNKFLNDFLQMRRDLHQPTPAITPVKGKVDSLKQAPKPEKEITLAYIIEKKPSNDKVIEYLKMRAEELLEAEE